MVYYGILLWNGVARGDAPVLRDLTLPCTQQPRFLIFGELMQVLKCLHTLLFVPKKNSGSTVHRESEEWQLWTTVQMVMCI
jgi:hypothetical protein